MLAAEDPDSNLIAEGKYEDAILATALDFGSRFSLKKDEYIDILERYPVLTSILIEQAKECYR